MKSTYRTKDLYEASFLYASHQKLLQLERVGSPFWFVFENRESCQELIDSYWKREARIDAKEFVDALRSLKDRLFAQN